MSKFVLGLSAFYHDSAAALVHNDEIIAAAQEERFTRKKHDPRFPHNAINYCLEEASLEPCDIDAIVFYDNPIQSWDRIVKNCLMVGEASYDQFEKAARTSLGMRIWVRDFILKSLGTLGKGDRVLFSEHHMSHAASAFYPSPFVESAIVTLDGVGEWASTTIGYGTGNSIELCKEIQYPHSLGLLYSAFTYYCGFKVNSGEYKLMGLAPYGKPVYYDTIRDNLIDIKSDGSFRLNMDYFGYLDTLQMINNNFNELFGGLPRQPESPLTKREMDLAASIQKITDELVSLICRQAKEDTGSKNLVMAGGVALNCVANGKILRENLFDNIWIQPASGDAGGALGAALLISHCYYNVPRRPPKNGFDTQKGSYLGPGFSSDEIIAFLERRGYPYQKISDIRERNKIIAKSIAQGKIIGYFSGRMEFGPRALGARSILGDPRQKETQSVMNKKIKFRESFRPFAPSVLIDCAKDFFELSSDSPYMLLVAPVSSKRQIPFNVDNFLQDSDDLLPIINQTRSDIPAVTHIDYSARIQTIKREVNPDFYDLIKEFQLQTGYGLLVNTSFNVRGEPIVCSPQDAYTCFMRTDMDLLVLEDCLLWKDKQPKMEKDEDWRGKYELD